MIKKSKLFLILLSPGLLILLAPLLVLFVGNPKIPVQLEERFELYDIAYQYEDHVYMIRLRNQDEIRYYIYLEEGYHLTMDGHTYQHSTYDILDSLSNHTFHQVLVTKDDTEVNQGKFYYGKTLEDLQFVDWLSTDYRHLVGVGIILLVIVVGTGVFEVWRISKRQQKEPVESVFEIGFVKKFKQASLLSKLGYIILVLLALVFPFITIVLIAVVYLYQLALNTREFKRGLISFGLFILGAVLTLSTAFGMYLLMNPDAISTKEYQMSSHLDEKSQIHYQKLVEESAFYALEPVVNINHNQFYLLILTQYNQSYSLPDFKETFTLEFVYEFIFEGTMTIQIFNDETNQMVETKDYPIKIKEENRSFYIPADVKRIYLQVFDPVTQEVLFKSESFDAIDDFKLFDKPLYKGLQYQENGLKNYLYLIISLNTGIFVFAVYAYRLRNPLFKRKKLKEEVNYGDKRNH